MKPKRKAKKGTKRNWRLEYKNAMALCEDQAKVCSAQSVRLEFFGRKIADAENSLIKRTAERDEARKLHLEATKRNVALTEAYEKELKDAMLALQQYETSYRTYRGRIMDLD
jgi:hypothetical protein